MSLEAIEQLHRKYAPSAIVYELVYTHSEIVRDIALELLGNYNELDEEFMVAAAMLHDIGVYELFNEDGTLKKGVKYITHGIEGENILRKEGYPETICRIASHHTGVGLTLQDVIDQQLPLPHKDFSPISDEELLITYADKFHSKTTPPYFNSYEWYKEDVRKYGEDKVAKFEQMRHKFGLPDLNNLSKKYGFEIR